MSDSRFPSADNIDVQWRRVENEMREIRERLAREETLFWWASTLKQQMDLNDRLLDSIAGQIREMRALRDRIEWMQARIDELAPPPKYIEIREDET